MKTSFFNQISIIKKFRSRSRFRIASTLLGLLGFACAWNSVQAGTFLTPTLDGNLSEWGSVPVAFFGNSNTPNVSTIQLANDNSYFYLAITYTAPVNLQFTTGGASVYLAFDTDSTVATGFNVFGANQVGSELGYSNDFPFQQSNGNFNSGGVNNGGGLIAPYNSPSVSTMEIGIPLNSTFQSTGLPTFPLPTFNLALYTQSLPGSDNFTGAIPYTLAVIPEPNSVALLAIGLVVALGAHRYLPRRLRA